MIWGGACACCGKRMLGLILMGNRLFCWECIESVTEEL
jgi:hypothetical protein